MIEEILEILHRGGMWTSADIAKELDVEVGDVRREVRKCRIGFLEGKGKTYIFTTKGGYSIEPKPENIIYEARLRLALGTGVLLNGVYVMKKGRQIAAKGFRQLRIEYKPKLVAIAKELVVEAGDVGRLKIGRTV